ncbi:BREX-2 system adenine-specific DNA-methyltransferase PglX [Actinoplanes sp. TBRC 11911]|uniref:BREX-2 system adenine-specific DNA-methyltransferase PglX n=1 Tax=Actinoplanes sp. TBRC 11911 TaxID=2729386 RepID=UPI00145CF6D4|nr:BREX-2 system adenine-specific DNA-methyltransferase PglX [Actinoplanes sp. TBRC 11911]NMO57592.1 BREX-2 system adenine-specific DNA-methyltransferase PglX [Actinoplanes sp. TBRC 11911]
MIELKALQGQVKFLVDDLREVVAANDELRSSLKGEWKAAGKAQRTAGTFESWLEDVLDQAAVAWVLGCVFVRFCEDNELISKIWIGGPTSVAPAERAVQDRQGYLVSNPRNNDRHWLREAFTYLAGLRPTGKIFDKHNPVWRFDISGLAAEKLSEFFRRGDGYVSLQSSGLETRFLGDLYQNLSAHARETYALLQTPEFVEEFILDRTFEPAYKEFGLVETKVIDPTCGSGHFVLGAFDRLINRWKEREPATDVRELVQRALDQVTGVDINPFAVAVARFRLMIAALNACGVKELETAPTFNLRLAVGDSLLGWSREESTHQGQLDVDVQQDREEEEKAFAYYSEDFDELAQYLRPNQYSVVVGNPPYITVKEKALNDLYRKRYSACSGKYALTVPFAQLFFKLGRRGDNNGDGAGYVGQITANSFMKREFGKKLINEFFAGEVELIEVVDVSGAYVPGHGTPTVVLIGQNRLVSQRYSGHIRAILGVRGEPSQPADPAAGLVWSAIVRQIDEPSSESQWVSSTDLDRSVLTRHPWSLTGGGASALMEEINAGSPSKIAQIADSVGITSFTLEDDLYVQPTKSFLRRRIPASYHRPMVLGDGIRDWDLTVPDEAAFPYDVDFNPVDTRECEPLHRFMWPAKTSISNSLMFGNQTKVDSGLSWSEFGRLTASKLRSPLSIAFAEVATHNHFVLDRGGNVFKQTAPVIKLTSVATEDDHLQLLGVLNSSTACFWLKQVSHNKAGSGIGRGIQPESWMDRYQFNATKLESFPLPAEYPHRLATILDQSAARLAALDPTEISRGAAPTRDLLAQARDAWSTMRARMIALQEELDWQTYHLYGLIDDDLSLDDVPPIGLGERAFEIVLAREVAAGEIETQWFERHGSRPITELPSHWPEEYRAVVAKRIAVIESDRNIGLIERPECKRRWATKGWDAMQAEALRRWLLDRLEAPGLWGGAPTPLSVVQLADRLRQDDDFQSVLSLWAGSDQLDVAKALSRLVADEHVPYLPSLRYNPTGLRKRVQWERTWELQRREDDGEKIDIPVPPKYGSGDFAKTSYWRNRGKLDVPKERFVSYPGAGRDGDATLLLGWAGWDHVAQAQALATVYLDRKMQAGWGKEGLLPLLAGVAELEPWLKQWFDEPRPGFPGSPAKFFTTFLDGELANLGADRGDLRTFREPA